jgi:ectoine hydroxylase-related dioxygenase (phytanoyl-CoA dioxygenase family)
MIAPHTVPDLAADYPLAPEQVAQFQRDGHVMLRGLCSPEEVAAYRPVIAGSVERFAGKRGPLAERDTIGQAFVLVGGIWNRDEGVARFTLARRFAKVAAELMQVDAVRLYHDVAITKEPGDGYTPWHQDSYYWPMDTIHTVTMWMALVEITPEMGALNFASGSYLAGDLGDEAISDQSHDHFERVIRERGFPVVNHVAGGVMAAGDATFHAGWTLHSAPGNATNRMREAITVVYYADGTRTFAQMGNPHREADFRAYMPGARPGGPAESRLNPVLYARPKSD